MNSICIIGIAGYSGTGKTPLIPKSLVEAWSNVNTPADREKALCCRAKEK